LTRTAQFSSVVQQFKSIGRVHARLVDFGRNTVDADIFEYILAKLAARIVSGSRTFLIKVKAHRGEPLNEGAGQWKKGTWTKTVRNTSRRGTAESLMEERLQIGTNKWRKGLFEERSVDTDGDQQMQNQNWRSDATDKWDMIATGKWIQKTVWNRWVTKSERDHPHKTPVTSTWTADFLTREGEGRKTTKKSSSDECRCLSMRGPFTKMGQASRWDMPAL
jgi:hypothetical protein